MFHMTFFLGQLVSDGTIITPGMGGEPGSSTDGLKVEVQVKWCQFERMRLNKAITFAKIVKARKSKRARTGPAAVVEREEFYIETLKYNLFDIVMTLDSTELRAKGTAKNDDVASVLSESIQRECCEFFVMIDAYERYETEQKAKTVPTVPN